MNVSARLSKITLNFKDARLKAKLTKEAQCTQTVYAKQSDVGDPKHES